MFRRSQKRESGNGHAAAQVKPVELLRIQLNPSTQKPTVWLAEQIISRDNHQANEELHAHIQGLLRLLTPQTSETEKPPEPEAAFTPPSNPIQPPVDAATMPAIDAAAEPPVLDDDLDAPFFTRLLESFRSQRRYATLQPATQSKPAKAGKTSTANNPTALDMFAQVDVILQRKLFEQPDAPPVEMITNGDEPLIRFDGKTYRHLDEVPDERVRAFIRSAIAEWEARQTRPFRTLVPT